ncbi:UDP-N-acetylglucosamine--peptide N-acetylglucosaminyltransferase GtfA subunit [Phocicoccus schoeneichii]|uniref:UDP-N-acetylglucosamine--peptide N-acetylglucosaminyltransferase GtfA subunit n=1 Tax=Phocicoccus schoeneichii TaxID=1812261 RepID=A0A6V7RD01_9BACL|nr:UDP-N-acetylglucosamine--peptide N-acetylglucosaminyltransferase GtfA subunit [Jeotgalicoccus schoeneichii]
MDRLYDNESRLFCERRYYKNNKIRGIILYKNDKVFKSFKGEKEFFIDFFNNVFNDGDIVFNDARLLDRANFVQTKDTKNVIVYHSTERDLNGELKASYATSTKNESNVSKYITSTEMQKASLINNYEIPEEKVNVISSYIDPVSQISYRDNSDIIYVGRLDENKQVIDIIEAFDSIKDEIPENCVLRIYGEGPNLESLKSQIKNLKLGKRVKFMGFANNLDEVYKTAKVSVLTSKFEGFALSIMESINYGCPVVAYDIEYGPNEIITQLETGVLIEKHNVKMLADTIKKIINDEITFENVQTDEKFTKESIQNRFIYLINELGGN